MRGISYTSYGLTDIGRVRSNNEDAWYADDEFGCYIVSDGMGGALAGEIASHMVTTRVPELLKERLPKRIKNIEDKKIRSIVIDVLETVNDEVCHRSQTDPSCKGMGATIVLLLIRNQKAMVVHVGDSRAYYANTDEMIRLTRDHNLLQVLIDEGVVDEADALGHPASSELLCDIGMPEGLYADISYFSVYKGGRILMCTDGIHGENSDEAIAKITKSISMDPHQVCCFLIDMANEGGGRDNSTAVVVDCN